MKITIPGCASITVQDRRWFVLRMMTTFDLSLRAGTTDLVFAELKALGYDAYVPRRRLDKWNRQKRVMAEWSEPLMPGYLFIVHPRPGKAVDDWSEVRGIKGVLGPLGDSDKPLLIPSKVVEVMMSAEFASTYDETTAGRRVRGETDRQRLEKKFAPGKRFMIDDGPFASFVAEIEEMTHENRVKALVKIFGRLVVVDLEIGQLGGEKPDAA